MSEINSYTETTTITAPEITCGGCAASIERALKAVTGVSKVEVDVPTKRVAIAHERNVTLEQLASALERAGFSFEV